MTLREKGDFLKIVTILIPIYNEAKNIKKLYEELNKITIKLSSYNFEYLFVDDGSIDESIAILEAIAKSDNRVKVIELSRNFGKEIALTAGIHEVSSDALIIMDADLQHPPKLINDFIKEWERGYEVIATKRVSIQKRSLTKRLGSFFFYKILNLISETKMEHGTTDFRLLDRVVVDILKSFTERNRMVRGLIDWMGFKKKYIEFEAPERNDGVEGYSLFKLFKLAINGLTSFSLFPLKVAGYIGVLISLIFGFLFGYMLIDKFILANNSFSPIAYVIVANSFLIGVVLMALGLIALYIGNIHIEVTNRPIFIVRKKINLEGKNEK